MIDDSDVAHAAGYHLRNNKKTRLAGFYDWTGRPFDRDQFFVVCSNA
jgi:hypothetical protein